MRWSIIALVILFVAPAALATPGLWGCCIPPMNGCFDGRAYGSEAAFRAACEQAGTEEYQAHVSGAGTQATCTSFGECTSGCCCATADVFDAPTINSNERLLNLTNAACSIKSDFEFKTRITGKTCVETCGGTPQPTQQGPAGTVTISGTVKNASGGNPLAGAQVFIPVPNSQLTTTSGADGTFTLSNVPKINTYVFSVHPSCQPGQIGPYLLDRDKTGIELKLTCERNGCKHIRPTFSEKPAVVRGLAQVKFTMKTEDPCQDIVQYEPLRCDGDFANCIALAPQETPTITDSGVLANSSYCYIVRTRFEDGTFNETEHRTDACLETGAAECMTGQTAPQWCGTQSGKQAILSCDETNALTAQLCDTGKMCSTQGGSAQCTVIPPCDKCNGLLGLFAKLFESLELPNGLFTTTCSEACNYDSSIGGKPLLVNAYSSCVGISSCTQYTSKEACTADVCKRTNCTWTNINTELGLGICVSKEKPPCSSCNSLFGYCNAELCSAISSSCYFDAERNGLAGTKGCIGKDEMACRFYDTKDVCVGTGQNAKFDIVKTGTGNDSTRTGGTNALTQPSKDQIKLGVCSWNNVNGICYKDADMSAGKDDDCIESGRYFQDQKCVTDRTPPVTQFFLANPAVYPVSALRSLPFRVSDDQSPVDLIKTYVCFGQGCYPKDTFSSVEIPTSGVRVLRYYSEDANGNLEQVKEVTLDVRNTGVPVIKTVKIEENR